MYFMSKKTDAINAFASLISAVESMEEEILRLRSDVKSLNAAVAALQVGSGGAREDRHEDEDGPPPFPTSHSIYHSPHRMSGSIHRFLLGVDVENDTRLLGEAGHGGTSLFMAYSKWADGLSLPEHTKLANIQAFGRAITKSGLFRRTKNAGGMNVHLLSDWRERLEVYRQDIEGYDASKAKMFNKSAP